MDEGVTIAERFEEQRPRLRAVAYRMLGSLSDAEDAVQETWLRLSRTQVDTIENLAAWLTTVVARVCLNVLRSRELRREEPLEVRVPDPIVGPDEALNPEHEALLSDSVGLALQVIIETLGPAERLAYVLHDMFTVPFEAIAPLIEKTPAATRQLASRARRRVRAEAPKPDPDLRRQREVVDAFFAASREGDFDALVAVLDPEVILRSDGGAGRARLTFILRGPQEVTRQALASGRLSPFVRPALVNGAAGVVVAAKERVMFVMAFTVAGGKIAAIDVLADPDRLAAVDLAVLS